MSLNGDAQQLARALEAAEHYLEHRPEQHWRAPSRFGAGGRLARLLAWRAARAEELPARRSERALFEQLRRRQAELPVSGPTRAPVDFAVELPVAGLVEVETNVGTLWMTESDVLVRPTLEEHGLLGGATSGLIRELEPGSTFVDVGAMVGYYSLSAARAVGPDGRVICVEPNPENLMLLRANLWRNGATSASVLPVAAWWERDHLSMLVHPEGGAAAELVPEQETDMLVPCARLDELVDGPVHLLKVDAERADHYVLRGAAGIIAENPEMRIVAEFCPGSLEVKGENPREILEEWLALGDLAILTHEIQPATIEEIIEAGPVVDVLITPRRKARRPQTIPAASAPGRRGLRGRLAEPYTHRRREFEAAAAEAAELLELAGRERPGGVELAVTLATAEVTTVDTGVGTLFVPSSGAPSFPPPDDPTRARLERALRPGMTFVDADAGVGFWSIFAARLVGPDGLVLALQPDAGLADILRANLWRHAWRNARVEVARLAVTQGFVAEPAAGALLPAAPLERLVGAARAEHALILNGPGG